MYKRQDKWAAPGQEGLLFPAVEPGGHMKSGALYKVYRRARAVAGRPDMRWHDLRHTGATMAAQAARDLAILLATHRLPAEPLTADALRDALFPLSLIHIYSIV